MSLTLVRPSGIHFSPAATAPTKTSMHHRCIACTSQAKYSMYICTWSYSQSARTHTSRRPSPFRHSFVSCIALFVGTYFL